SGELCFCIGLSEPNSGSDVFAASTRATKTDGGWLVNGRKIWTSNVHNSDYMIALLRTSPPTEENRRSEEHTSELQSLRQLLRRRPVTPLFPYTTLFRSLGRAVLLHRPVGAQFRLGRVRRLDAGDEDGWRLAGQRSQDLDLERP